MRLVRSFAAKTLLQRGVFNTTVAESHPRTAHDTADAG